MLAKPTPPRDSTRPGVRAADRIKAVITKKDVYIAYSFLMLLMLVRGLQNYTGQVLRPYATSAFKSHSMLTTAGVVERVLTVIAYPIYAKLADNTSRISWQLFSVPIMFSIIAVGMMAGCHSISVYMGANVFVGLAEGFLMLQHIYIAETTSIASRALYNVLAESCANIVSMYSGTEIGGAILDNLGTASGWRTGYWMYAILEAVFAVPFIAILAAWWLRSRRASREKNETVKSKLPSLLSIWHDYDVLGTCLFAAGIALFLVPLTLAKGVGSKWHGSNLAMIIIGPILLILFGFWDCLSDAYRPAALSKPRQPLIPFGLLKDRTLLLVCALSLFDFLAYGVIQSYFTTYMQVTVNVAAARASQIDNTIRIVFNAWAILVGFSTKFWSMKGTVKAVYIIVPGTALCLIGVGMDIKFVTSNSIPGLVMAKVLWGVGRAMYQTIALVAVQASASRENLGIATGVVSMSNSIGGTVGTAIGGAIWTNQVLSKLMTKLPEAQKGLARKIYGSIVVAKSFEKGTEVRQAIDETYSEVLRIMAIVGFCSMCIVFLASLLLPRSLTLNDPDQEDEKETSPSPHKLDDIESKEESKEEGESNLSDLEPTVAKTTKRDL